MHVCNTLQEKMSGGLNGQHWGSNEAVSYPGALLLNCTYIGKETILSKFSSWV